MYQNVVGIQNYLNEYYLEFLSSSLESVLVRFCDDN